MIAPERGGARPGGIAGRAPTTALVLLGAFVVGATLPHLLTAASPSYGFVLAVVIVIDVVAFVLAASRASVFGFAVGAYSIAAQIVGWTIPNAGLLLAVIAAAATVVFALLAIGVPRSRPLGLRTNFAFWIGIATWVPAIVGALVLGDLAVATFRMVLAALSASMLALAARDRGVPFAWGLVAALHVGVALIGACGVRAPVFVEGAPNRFAGGACAFVHPNVLGVVGWTLVLAWLALPGPTIAGRLPGIAAAAALPLLADARTSTAAALIGAALIAAAALRGPQASREPAGARTAALAASATIVVAIAGLALVVGSQFFLRQRAPNVGVLTGRQTIWTQAVADFHRASPGVRVLGDPTDTTGAKITVPGAPGGGEESVDNAFLVLLRRGGLVSLAVGLVGAFLLLRFVWRALGRYDLRLPVALAVGALASAMVESSLFGGFIWMWILAAWLLADDVERVT